MKQKKINLVLLGDDQNPVANKEFSIPELASLLDDNNINECNDDADVVFYLIHHPNLRIKDLNKSFYFQNYSAGRGLTPVFTFMCE